MKPNYTADVVVHAKAMSTSVPLSRQPRRPCTKESPHHPYIHCAVVLKEIFCIVQWQEIEIFVYLKFLFTCWTVDLYQTSLRSQSGGETRLQIEAIWDSTELNWLRGGGTAPSGSRGGLEHCALNIEIWKFLYTFPLSFSTGHSSYDSTDAW